MYRRSNSTLSGPSALGSILPSGLAFDMIFTSSRRRSLSAPRYQKTVLAAIAEKEAGSASSSPGTGSPADTAPSTAAAADLPTLVIDDDDADVPPVEAEDLRLVGGIDASSAPPYSSESRNDRSLAPSPPLPDDDDDDDDDPRYISASRGIRHTSPPTSGTADSCAHAPWRYSSASAAFCALRSSSFRRETDFGRNGGRDDPSGGGVVATDDAANDDDDDDEEEE